MKAFYFPNGMVATYGLDDKQIPNLQGVYSEKLHKEIISRSDSKTELEGFPTL